MFLALSAIRHGPEEFATPVTTPLTAASYTIGRGQECDLVLEDPTRHISRLHATISQQGGAYLLTVNSRVNPVIINGKAVAVGQSAALSVGDQVTIGEYLFDVVPHDETMKAATRSEADPLATPLGGLATGPSTLDALFGPNTVKVPEPPSARSNLDDLIGGHRSASDDPLLNVLGGGTPAARPDAGNGAVLAHNQNDPLMQLLGQGTSHGPSGIVPNDGPAFPLDVGRGVASIDDLLGSGSASAADPLGLGISDHRGRSDAFGGGRGGSLELDHVHDVNLPMSFPQGRAREQGPSPVVPPVQRARPDPPQRIESPPPPRAVPPTADDPLAALLDGKPRDGATPSSRNREDPLGLLAEPGLGSPAPRSFDVPFVERPSRRPYAPPPDAEAPASPRNAPETARAPVLTAPIVQAFLEGAGMAGVKIRDDEAEAFIRECGEVCRAAIEGLMGLLLARATVKEELRANDRTMIAARENNPLKLVESVDEAIKFVLDPSTRTDAFLPPSKAVADACSDLRSHEIALVVGMRSALVGAIRRFDPVKLEKLLQKQGGVSLLASRKAKLWDCFLDHYDKTNRDAEDNFDKVFGADFLRAYQEQVKRLRKG